MGSDSFLYSLRIRPYLHSGSDEEKVDFLKKTATNDYLIAKPCPVPFKSNIIKNWTNREI